MTGFTVGFEEAGDRVYVLTYPVFNVNSVLIVGDSLALLVDTLSTSAQAAELGAAARRVTGLPISLVNTHFHFDHTFGNDALAEEATPIWGHPACVQELGERGEHWRRYWQQEIAEEDEALALAIGEVRVRPPNRPVTHRHDLDLGGRIVSLEHYGRGHTEGDLVVRAGDILVAGDLVEQGAPPSFEDSYPLEWPETLSQLLDLPFASVIPGHGSVVDRSFVIEQHGELSQLDWLIRDGHADGSPPERVVTASPLTKTWGQAGAVQSAYAVKRGYTHLDGG